MPEPNAAYELAIKFVNLNAQRQHFTTPSSVTRSLKGSMPVNGEIHFRTQLAGFEPHQRREAMATFQTIKERAANLCWTLPSQYDYRTSIYRSHEIDEAQAETKRCVQY